MRGIVDTGEYLAFARRIVRRLGDRLDGAEPEEFREIVETFTDFEDMLIDAMEKWVETDKWLAPTQRERTWAALGRLMGMSRQQAEQKWSRKGRARLSAAQAAYRERKRSASSAAR